MSAKVASPAAFKSQVQSLLRSKKLSPVERRRKVNALCLTTLMGMGYTEGVQLVLEHVDGKIEQ